MSHGGDDEIHEEHEEHVNHEAWVIPYADLLTLLMAMFIALFAISRVLKRPTTLENLWCVSALESRADPNA